MARLRAGATSHEPGGPSTGKFSGPCLTIEHGNANFDVFGDVRGMHKYREHPKLGVSNRVQGWVVLCRSAVTWFLPVFDGQDDAQMLIQSELQSQAARDGFRYIYCEVEVRLRHVGASEL